ncbi:sigma-70 family RNA polymerase sigma factor [Pigmentiphaga aceris]|uniref:Sigma-70 family RNA polymerase sigma factor n=1 Tax=Pigmentiphaga aceris TaxID=1940612 RepID=A0A5C0ATH6_9BURK|nr:sigma-70 family RNA polymerase sigma factor [Pigmentiphaga aceris]QEI04976.1 sigma-70 family RNA polymerase sigma factor [Pigmentiphaga aceris]
MSHTLSTFPVAEAPAIEALYRAHHSWLLGRLKRRLSNSADAEDVTAETFVQVVEQGSTSDIREPKAFLTTIAKRVLFHLWRRQDLERAYLQTLMHQPEAASLSVEESALLVEAITQIDRALDTLPLPVKTAFLYSRLDGLSYPEIAKLLGVSLATVERHMKRALLHCLTASL